jgi:hypothetical protein
MPRVLGTLAAIVAALHASSAGAAEPSTSKFSFSGFGTGGVVHSSEENADFTSTFSKPDGAGYSDSWSGDVDSLIAGQITANFTPKLSAVLQAISEQNHDGTYEPHVEWANFKIQLTPDFSVRAGRMVLPSLLVSDTRKVGFTYPWVRPPLEVYSLLPVTWTDGLDVSYRLHAGDWTNTLQANTGRNDIDLSDGGTTEVRELRGISNSAERGPLTARITYLRARLTAASLNVLFDAFRSFGPQGIAVADRYDLDDTLVSVVGVSVGYDPGQWFAMSEWSRLDSHAFIGTRTAWHASGGYRFAKLTPYVTYAQSHADTLADPGLDVTALPPFLAGPATGLNIALNSVLSANPVQNTVSIGARWDFMRNTAIKVQFDRTNIGAGSLGALINLQPGYEPGGTFRVFSATIDFVF